MQPWAAILGGKGGVRPPNNFRDRRLCPRRIVCDQSIVRSAKIECLSLYYNVISLIYVYGNFTGGALGAFS